MSEREENEECEENMLDKLEDLCNILTEGVTALEEIKIVLQGIQDHFRRTNP